MLLQRIATPSMLGLQLNGKATGRRLRVGSDGRIQPEVRQSPAQDPTRVFEQFLLVGRLRLEVRAGHAAQPPELKVFQDEDAPMVGLQPVRKSTSESGANAAVLIRSSGEEPTSPRRRARVASMAWMSTRRLSTNAP